MNYLSFINEVVFSIIEAIFILLTFCVLTANKKFTVSNKSKTLVFVFLYTLFSSWVPTFTDLGIHTLVIFILMTLLLSILTKTNLYTSVTANLVITIASFFIEISVLIVIMVITNNSMSIIIASPSLTLLGSAIVKPIQILTLAILFKLDLVIFRAGVCKSDHMMSSLILLQTFFLGLVILSANYIVAFPSKIIKYNILLFTIYIVFIILIFIDYKERRQLLSLQHKFNLQEEYIKNIESIINIIRKEKHDFLNHLNTIYGLCRLSKPDTNEKIKQYIDKIASVSHSSYRFINTGNDYIDALIAVKSNFAYEHSIKLQIDIREQLLDIDIQYGDIVGVIGNIIDNAFDAVLSSSAIVEKFVAFTTYRIGNSYYISIKNNGPCIPEKYLSKIFQNGFSTKPCKNDRGFGLYIVRQIIDRYRGTISVTSTEYETEFIIKLGVKNGSDKVYLDNTSKAYPAGESKLDTPSGC